MSYRSTALIIGASRGLGLALAREYLRRGWQVVATVRDPHQPTGLQALQAEAGDALEIEAVDFVDQEQVAALRERLGQREFDVLFVNAGVTNTPTETIGEVSTEEFMRVMVTNALSPMRVVERFIDRVSATGQVAVMSSELASVANNVVGGWEVYRASKAALNTLMRSFVARRAGDPRTFCVMAPGWVRTDMGGCEAPLDIETSIPRVVDTLAARQGTRGLVFVNYLNEVLPW